MQEAFIIVSESVQALKWKFVSKDWKQILQQTNGRVLEDYSLEMFQMQKVM